MQYHHYDVIFGLGAQGNVEHVNEFNFASN